ncbi:MAG: DUF6325 family protein [Candidatus Nanopelagicales bacterium]
MSQAAADDIELGPIDYLVVEYPGGQMTGEALPHLVSLVESGTIRILDVALVRNLAGGGFQAIRPEDLVAAGATEFELLAGVATGMLSDEDLAEVAAIMDADSAAVILVYENSWAAPMATAMRRAGGQLISNGRIPVEAVVAALGESVDATITGR